jgi:hypothetical protein
MHMLASGPPQQEGFVSKAVAANFTRTRKRGRILTTRMTYLIFGAVPSIVPSAPWPGRWIFATGALLAPLIYEILPVGPGKLVHELHIAESRQLVGTYAFLTDERLIETTD